MKRLAGLFSILLLLGCNEKTSQKNTLTAKISGSSVTVKKKQPLSVNETIFDFENDKTGILPPNWLNETGEWKVVKDGANKVMAQVSKNHSGSYYNVTVNRDLNFKDVEINVKFKGITGREDQGGGPVWRYKDIKNYYIARPNPLENNYRVYKVINGHRKELKSADLDIRTAQWYKLKIEMKGNRIKCYFDGRLVLETTDDSFKDSGKVGLWSKADAVTSFDDMAVKGQ